MKRIGKLGMLAALTLLSTACQAGVGTGNLEIPVRRWPDLRQPMQRAGNAADGRRHDGRQRRLRVRAARWDRRWLSQDRCIRRDGSHRCPAKSRRAAATTTTATLGAAPGRCLHWFSSETTTSASARRLRRSPAAPATPSVSPCAPAPDSDHRDRHRTSCRRRPLSSTAPQ